jgi:predicted GNAT superfamily acetyltransferase
MEWVFPPLVARTAHFHLTSIGATSRTYEAYYHSSTEGRSGPFATTDRLVALWEVASPRVEARLSGDRPPLPEGTWLTRVEIEDGLPRLKETFLNRKEPRLLLEIPPDLYDFSLCPEALGPWREGVGELLEKYINSEGYVLAECLGPVTGGLRRPFYLLERDG